MYLSDQVGKTFVKISFGIILGICAAVIKLIGAVFSAAKKQP